MRLSKILSKHIAVFALLMAPAFAVYLPVSSAYACSDSLFGITAWYRGMQEPDPNCGFKPIQSGGKVDARATALKIGLNILQAGMAIAGYAALIFLIIGGFRYMTAAGSPEGMSSAKKTITNAIIGMIIALLAVAIVNAVAGIIK